MSQYHKMYKTSSQANNLALQYELDIYDTPLLITGLPPRTPAVSGRICPMGKTLDRQRAVSKNASELCRPRTRYVYTCRQE